MIPLPLVPPIMAATAAKAAPAAAAFSSIMKSLPLVLSTLDSMNKQTNRPEFRYHTPNMIPLLSTELMHRYAPLAVQPVTRTPLLK